jgi:hypothetical protein
LLCTPLKFQYILDDGAVFYVNGTEVLRIGMPSDVVTNQTLASRTTGLDQVWEDPVAFQTAPLVADQNLVAVEVHQCSTTSSDVGFAVRLVGRQQTITPSFRITGITVDASNNVSITHNGASLGVPVYVQETATLAADPVATGWSTRPGGPHTSPYDAGPPTGTRFFRLSTNP